MSNLNFFLKNTSQDTKLWYKPAESSVAQLQANNVVHRLVSGGKKSQAGSGVTRRDFFVSEGHLYYHKEGSDKLRGALDLSFAYIEIKPVS